MLFARMTNKDRENDEEGLHLLVFFACVFGGFACSGHTAGEFNERLHAEASGAVFGVFPLLVDEGCSCDVEVGPCGFFGDEFLEE